MQDNVLMPEIVRGIRAAGLQAIKQARMTNTKLVVLVDGKPVEISPDEAEAMLHENEAKNPNGGS